MNTGFAKSLGILPLSYIEFRSFVKKSIPMSSRTANTSMGMLSGPTAFPCFIFLIAALTSSFKIGGPSMSFFIILEHLDIDGKDLRVIRNLYWDQSAAVRIGGELSEYTLIKRGVRQGCVMSPDLFNIYSEMILRNLENYPGVKINGEKHK